MDILKKTTALGPVFLTNPVTGAAVNLRGIGQADGRCNEKHVAIYQQYAQSGMGMVVTDAIAVSEECQKVMPTLGAWEDEQIDSLRTLANTLQKNGVIGIMQLAHRGAACYGGKTLADMPKERLSELQMEFVQAAWRAYLAGFRGVELHAVHGYFLSQVLSPYTNDVSWDYRDTPQDRVRYVAEIVQAIRAMCGYDWIIGIRLSCNNPTIQESILMAQILEQSSIDYISVSHGVRADLTGGKLDDNFDIGVEMPEDFPYGSRIFAASLIRQNVNVPVIGVGNIKRADQARDILEKGYADIVAIGRARLADPNWYLKEMAGETPNPCLHCARCGWLIDGDHCPARKKLNSESVFV